MQKPQATYAARLERVAKAMTEELPLDSAFLARVAQTYRDEGTEDGNLCLAALNELPLDPEILVEVPYGPQLKGSASRNACAE